MKIFLALLLLIGGTYIILNHQGTVSYDVGGDQGSGPGLNVSDIPIWIGVVADVCSILLFIADIRGRSKRNKKG